ncbi:MAG TPA: CbiX/SirB N-terminal domain-containing protein [Azospirillum sp.]|nr:CbiX/SirB N-terminal domain-containing protein [Azospirillum sp.]
MSAQPTCDATRPEDAALLLFAHGTSDGGGAAIATALASAVRRRGPFAAVGTSFALQSPSPAAALAALPQRRVVVVPLLATEGGVARMVLPRLLAESGATDRLTVLPPLGLDPEVVGIAADLADSAMAAAGLDPARTCVLMAGHGSVRRPASERSTTALVDALAAMGRYGEVGAIYLEQPPLASNWSGVTGCPDVVVVPFFLSGGHHEEEDLPAMLRDGGGSLDGRTIEGRRLWLTPAVGRHPRLADLIRRRALAALGRNMENEEGRDPA